MQSSCLVVEVVKGHSMERGLGYGSLVSWKQRAVCSFSYHHVPCSLCSRWTLSLCVSCGLASLAVSASKDAALSSRRG